MILLAAAPAFVDQAPAATVGHGTEVLAAVRGAAAVSGCEVPPADLAIASPGHWLLTRSTARHRVLGLRQLLTDCPALPEGDGVLELVPTGHSLAGALWLVPGVARDLTVAGRPLEYRVDGARL